MSVYVCILVSKHTHNQQTLLNHQSDDSFWKRGLVCLNEGLNDHDDDDDYDDYDTAMTFLIVVVRV